MTMTHKEAVSVAVRAYFRDGTIDENMTNAIRAYIEARGLVLVPKK